MEQFIFFESDAIEDFIRQEGRGAHTKDYELVAAILMNVFCERQWRESCRIGFPITPEASRQIDDGGTMSFYEVVDVIRKRRSEDTPVDFSIASTKNVQPGKKKKGMYVQVKRFGKGMRDPDTDALIKFLLSLRYQRLPITLLIISEPGRVMEYKRVQSAIDPKAFPFERLIIVGAHDNKFSFISLFPESGMEEYEMDGYI